MEEFVSIKPFFAKPMTRRQYIEMCGDYVQSGSNLDDPGYLLEFMGGLSRNVPEMFNGYVQWIPADVFQNLFAKIDR